MKNYLSTFIGVVGSMIAGLLGGWDMSIQTLLMFQVFDYASGLIVAGVFHNSPKTENGAIESKAGWKGLIRKGVTLGIVMMANRLDMQLGTTYIRDGVCIAFITNELISIVENCGLMGITMPDVIKNGLEVLTKEKSNHV